MLHSLAQRLGDREIAAALGISATTAKNHLRHTSRKLGVSDRTSAALATPRGDANP